MFSTLNKHQIAKVFSRLGPWSIPLLAAIVLLPLLALAKSLFQSPTPPADAQEFRDDLSKLRGWRDQARQSQTGVTPPVVKPRPTAQVSPQRRTHPKVSTRAKATPPAVEMRVAVVKDAQFVAIATSTPGRVLDDSGKVLRTIPAGQAVHVKPAGQGIGLNSWQAPRSVWLQATEGGYVYTGEHWYRGRMRLILEGNSLLAVNHVNLEKYLYSVVGSEMPSYWPLEALKAQAIAARSYALVQYVRRSASPDYHMGSDEAWQVYKGLDGETNSTHQAVNQTSGQFLSYQGGLVESLYAATDEIVIDVHGGRGMSQTGAQKLALGGQNHLNILAAYYPGTKLTQLKSQ